MVINRSTGYKDRKVLEEIFRANAPKYTAQIIRNLVYYCTNRIGMTSCFPRYCMLGCLATHIAWPFMDSIYLHCGFGEESVPCSTCFIMR